LVLHIWLVIKDAFLKMAEKDKSINKIVLEVLKLLVIIIIIVSSSALILLAL